VACRQTGTGKEEIVQLNTNVIPASRNWFKKKGQFSTPVMPVKTGIQGWLCVDNGLKLCAGPTLSFLKKLSVFV